MKDKTVALSNHRQWSLRRLRSTLGILILLVATPAMSQTVRQITDFRADRLGEYAIDASGTAVVVVSTADPFGVNPSHAFQALAWTGADAASSLTGFGGLLEPLSVSDDGQWVVFVSIENPLGTNTDRGPELFLQSADGSVLRQLTDRAGSAIWQITRARISGSGNRVAFVDRDGLWIVEATGDGLSLLVPGAKVESLSITDDGQLLAFSTSQVFRVDADGSNLQQLTSTVDDSLGATISGDGELIAYESAGEIFVIGPATGGVPFLLGAGSEPSITDDAAWVYFSGPDEDNVEIHRSLTTGGGAQRVTRTAAPLQNRRPLISGDGKRVAFVRSGTEDDPEGSRRLMVMNSDGSEVEQLGPPESNWRWAEPDVTPDGSRIVVLGGEKDPDDLYRIETDGTDRVQITDGMQARHPSVTADGETIVFESSLDLTGDNPCGKPQIFRIGADQSGLAQLTPSGSCVTREHPVISRDGSTVVYQQEGGWLYAIPAAGGTPSQVVMDSRDYPKMPRLSCDGTRVVYQSGSELTGINVFIGSTDGSSIDSVSYPEYVLADPSPDISADGEQVAYTDFYQVTNGPPFYYAAIMEYQSTTGMSTALTDVPGSDTRISGDGESVYFVADDFYRVGMSSAEPERASGLTDARTRVVPAASGNNPEYAVDGSGRAVFAWALDSTGDNPDLSHELWIVDFAASPLFDIEKTTPAEIQFTADPRGMAYDVIRGDLANVTAGAGDTVDLGPVTCLADDSPDTFADDPSGPTQNQVFFYLFRWSDSWGASSSGAPRMAGVGDCAP